MFRTDTRLGRTLPAVATAVGAVLLLTVPDGAPILTGEMLTVGVTAGVAVYANGGGDCGDCSCC